MFKTLFKKKKTQNPQQTTSNAAVVNEKPQEKQSLSRKNTQKKLQGIRSRSRKPKSPPRTQISNIKGLPTVEQGVNNNSPKLPRTSKATSNKSKVSVKTSQLSNEKSTKTYNLTELNMLARANKTTQRGKQFLLTKSIPQSLKLKKLLKSQKKHRNGLSNINKQQFIYNITRKKEQENKYKEQEKKETETAKKNNNNIINTNENYKEVAKIKSLKKNSLLRKKDKVITPDTFSSCNTYGKVIDEFVKRKNITTLSRFNRLLRKSKKSKHNQEYNKLRKALLNAGCNNAMLDGQIYDEFLQQLLDKFPNSELYAKTFPESKTKFLVKKTNLENYYTKKNKPEIISSRKNNFIWPNNTD
jgi:hypothetical protein